MICTHHTHRGNFYKEIATQFLIGFKHPDAMAFCSIHLIDSIHYSHFTHFKEVTENEYVIYCVHNEIEIA